MQSISQFSKCNRCGVDWLPIFKVYNGLTRHIGGLAKFFLRHITFFAQFFQLVGHLGFPPFIV